MWYYASAGDYEGPFQEAYLGRKLRAGVITKKTLVWRDGMKEWLPLEQTELLSLITEQAPWQKQPSEPPQPPPRAWGSQASDEAGAQQEPQGTQQRRSRRSSLQDYEQSGYEKPQAGRPAPSEQEWAEEEAEGESQARGAPKANKAKHRQKPVEASGHFENLSSVTFVVTFMFALSALLSAFILFNYVRHGSGSHQLHTWSLSDARPLLKILGLVSTVAGLAFLVWVYRAISNLPRIGARSLDLSAGWVVVSFLIPFLNIFVPYLALRKLWQASFAPRQWAKQAITPMLTFMWLAWIFATSDWDNLYPTGGVETSQGVVFLYGDSISMPSLWPFALSIAVDVMVVLFVRAVWHAQRDSHEAIQR